MVDNYNWLNWLDPKFGESVLSGASQAFAAWTQTVWDPAVFSAWNLSFSKDRWEVESLEEKWQHVYASGLETAQAVTPFFNMFFLFDVSCGCFCWVIDSHSQLWGGSQQVQQKGFRNLERGSLVCFNFCYHWQKQSYRSRVFSMQDHKQF